MGQVQPVEELSAILSGLEAELGEVTAGPTPLEGGITNRNFKVRFGKRDCVVRLPGKDTRLLGIDRRAERLANQAAAELGLAPAMLAAKDEVLVTEYVAGQPLAAADLRAAPEAVALALRGFHDAGVGLPVRFWVPELLASYASVVRERGGRVPAAYRRAEEIAQRIAEVVPLRKTVACHNDLLPANVLEVESAHEVILVDWEYAGMGHRFFDLGNLAVNAEFGEGEELRLLNTYLGREPSPQHLGMLRLMRVMSDAREAAWGVIQGAISELEFDFRGYAEKHFERLERAVGNSRFVDWLNAAAA